jgi:regulator of replication initiation timing
VSNDIVLYQRVSQLEKELDEVLKELSQFKQNYQELVDMLKREKK